jgi:hypothetical protein
VLRTRHCKYPYRSVARILTSTNKATWKIVNEIIGKKKTNAMQKSVFKADGLEISDPTEIANRFCEYFTNIGINQAKQIQRSSVSHKEFLPNSIFLNPVDESEIIQIAKTFDASKAAGYDRIPMSVIKQSINLISIPIAHIMNLSINHGIVPNEMKIARVIPLFKSGDYGTFTNYRPVFILPSFSKFLERIIYNRLIN